MPIDFIRLHSGKRFHILHPTTREIDIKDIVWALSHICRFTGHTHSFYSVAQHCCHVADILPDNLKLQGLMHDAQEAYCQDLAQPIKQYLPQYKELEFRIEQLVSRKYRLLFPMPAAVKTADMTLLVTEMRDLMRNADYKMHPFAPLTQRLKPWSSEKARREFMRRFNALTK